MADVVLKGMTEAGLNVAIVSRTQSKLDAVAAKHPGNVKGFGFDLSNTAGMKALLESIAADMGPIKVIYYNAVKFALPYNAPAEDVISGVNINFASLWASFGAVIDSWESSGGVFLMSGGGLAANGAYSVGFGAQFGAIQKSIMKNFVEGASATYGEKGVHVCALEINALVFGGDNIGDEYNQDPGKSAAFAEILKGAVKSALMDQTGNHYVIVAP